MQAVTWLAISAAFVLGMVPALLGSLRPALARRFGVEEPRVGSLVHLFNLALVPLVVLCGLLTDRLGVQGMVLVGCLLIAGAFEALAARPTYLWGAGSMMVLAAGTACLGTATVVLLPQAFHEFFGARLTASLCMGFAFFALGALMTPTFAEAALRGLELRRAIAALAIACAVPAVFVPWSHIHPPIEEVSQVAAILSEPAVWLAGLVLALYTPVEFCLGSWSLGYLTGLGVTARRAGWMLSSFWFAFLVSRVLATWCYSGWLADGSEGVVLVILASASMVVLGDLIGTTNPRRVGLDLVLLGLLLGPAFPLLLGAAFQHTGGASGTVYGVILGLGSVGGLALAPVITSQTREWALQRALRIPLVLTVLLACAALVLALA